MSQLRALGRQFCFLLLRLETFPGPKSTSGTSPSLSGSPRHKLLSFYFRYLDFASGLQKTTKEESEQGVPSFSHRPAPCSAPRLIPGQRLAHATSKPSCLLLVSLPWHKGTHRCLRPSRFAPRLAGAEETTWFLQDQPGQWHSDKLAPPVSREARCKKQCYAPNFSTHGKTNLISSTPTSDETPTLLLEGQNAT